MCVHLWTTLLNSKLLEGRIWILQLCTVYAASSIVLYTQLNICCIIRLINKKLPAMKPTDTATWRHQILSQWPGHEGKHLKAAFGTGQLRIPILTPPHSHWVSFGKLLEQLSFPLLQREIIMPTSSAVMNLKWQNKFQVHSRVPRYMY